MGYSTMYSLSVLNKSPEENYDLIAQLMKVARDLDGEEADILFALDVDGGCMQACKWYDFDEDMARYSTYFPDVVFELDGVGEESDDQWKAYFHDGKMQKVMATITYEPFNPEKLKEVEGAFNPLKPLHKEA